MNHTPRRSMAADPPDMTPPKMSNVICMKCRGCIPCMCTDIGTLIEEMAAEEEGDMTPDGMERLWDGIMRRGD